MITLPNLQYIGQVAVFYLPYQKWDTCRDAKGKPVKFLIHYFLINHYDAYTLDHGPRATGYWRESKDHTVVRDQNVRYEVSFGGKDKIPEFVDFLSQICAIMNEQAIYLTMGRHSYHVLPKKGTDEIREEVFRGQGI
jgi:hypothetical protein